VPDKELQNGVSLRLGLESAPTNPPSRLIEAGPEAFQIPLDEGIGVVAKREDFLGWWLDDHAAHAPNGAKLKATSIP